MYTIVKVYNNNTVAARTDDRRECVLTGAGIGFSKKPEDIVPVNKVEKIYYIQNELQTKFLRLLDNSTPESLWIAEAIVERAEKQLNSKLGSLAVITLSDHLSFAVERQKKGINMPNLLAEEVKLLYPGEYQIGMWGLAMVEQKTGVQLFLDEASYIAMHLVNAAVQDKKETMAKVLQAVKDVLDIIRRDYGIQPVTDSENFLRLTTHIKFLIREICKGKSLKQEKLDDADAMVEYLLKKNSNSSRCIFDITDYIKQEFKYELEKSEILYLLIYINRII